MIDPKVTRGSGGFGLVRRLRRPTKMKKLEASVKKRKIFHFGVRPKCPGAEPAWQWRRKMALITL